MVDDRSGWSQTHQPDQPSRSRADVETSVQQDIDLASEGNNVVDPENDPDFNLTQYYGRRVGQSVGFFNYIPARDPLELPEPKRTQILELLKAQMDDL